MNEQYPISNAPIEAILGMLMLRLAERNKLTYIDIYPEDPSNPSEGYVYEWSEPTQEPS